MKPIKGGEKIMKKTLKILCLAISVMLLLGTTACGGKRGVRGTLHIASFEGGYGATWTQELAKAYKKHNPSANVKVTANPLVRDTAKTAFETNDTDVDLFFVDGIGVGKFCEDYDSLADISELYESTPKVGETEEDVLIKNKIMPEIVDQMKYGGDWEKYAGKYYLAPSPSGPCSLILNTDALDMALGEGNWEAPRTTDEMFALADRISAARAKVQIAGVNYRIYPMIYSGGAITYMRYLSYHWMAQYDGIDVYNDMLGVKKNGVYDQSAYQPEGKLKAYQTMERLIKRDNNYCESSCMTNKFSESQKYFLMGRACMYVTGDWFERETEGSTTYKPDLLMVRTPVISDLAAKLETEYSVSLGATAAAKDAKLSEIIKAVDDGEASVSGVDERVFDAVKEKRSYTFTLATGAVGAVPRVSVNQDMAIDFLRFMYSDEGIKIVLKECKSYLPVVNAKDIAAEGELSTFRQSVNKIMNGDTKYIFGSNNDPIHYRAGLDFYVGNEMPEVAMGKKSGAVTAQKYLETEAKLLNQKWADLMKVVG